MAGHGQSLPDPGAKDSSLSLPLSWLAFATAVMGMLLVMCVCSLDLPKFLYPSHSWPRSGGSLHLDGKELQSCDPDQGLCACRCPSWGTFYLPLWSIFCTLWLPNFISAKILLNDQFIFQKISQVSELGERASGLSFCLLGCHLLSSIPTYLLTNKYSSSLLFIFTAFSSIENLTW